MLHTTQLPKGLWGEMLMHATWLNNWMSTKALMSVTPFEALTRTKPNLSKHHEWGQKIFIHDMVNPKLGSWAKDRCCVGFDPKSKGSRVYWADKTTVVTEQSIKFDTDYILVPNANLPNSLPSSAMLSSTALPMQSDIIAKDIPEIPMTEPVLSAPAPQGRGTRLKHLLQYVQCLQESKLWRVLSLANQLMTAYLAASRALPSLKYIVMKIVYMTMQCQHPSPRGQSQRTCGKPEAALTTAVGCRLTAMQKEIS